MMERLYRIAVMTAANTHRAFRTPANIIWTLVVPIVFSLVIAALFSGPGGGPQTVYIVDEDRTETSRRFVDGLASRSYQPRAVPREEAEGQLAAGSSGFVLIIPSGFEAAATQGQPRVEILHGADYTGGDFETWATAVVQALVRGEAAPSVEVTQESPNGNRAGDALAQMRTAFGVYIVFAFAALFARGGALHQEREDGTLHRLVAAGVPYGEVVAAHVASLFGIGLLQAAVVLTVTGAFGTLWLAAGWGVLALALLGSLYVAAGLALGLAGITRSATLLQGLAGGLPPLLAMMGGAFFPLEVAPLALQRAARINPIFWAMELVTEGYMYRGVSSQLIPLFVLILLGTLGSVVGIQRLRRMEL